MPHAPAAALPVPHAGSVARALLRAPRLRALALRLALPLVLALLAAPLALTDIPPLLDYPNHLARMHVIAAHASDPAVAAIYDLRWRLIPNIGMDLVVPALARVMPLDIAGRLFAAAALLLPVLGVVALHRAAFGGRDAWPLAAGAALAWNGIFVAGFLNYLVGAGLALLGAAAWWRMPRAGPRVALACALSPMLFLCHLFAWGFYGLLVGALTLAGLRGRAPAAALATLAGAALPFVLPAALLAAHAAVTPAAVASPGGPGLQVWALWKLVGLLTPTLAYRPPLDAALLGLGVLALVLPGLAGRLDIAWALAPAAAILAAAFAVLPFASHGTAFIDTRLPILLAFVVVAMTRPRGIPPPVLVLGGLAFAARLGVIAAACLVRGDDLAALRAVIAGVPAGARVVAVSAHDDPPHPGAAVPEPPGRRVLLVQDAMTHLPALLLLEHDAFWPLLFSAPGKQPIAVRPPYARLAMAEGWLPSSRELVAPTPGGRAVAPYLAHWRRDFDYVLCLHAGRLRDPAALDPGALVLVRADGVAALYRVRPPP